MNKYYGTQYLNYYDKDVMNDLKKINESYEEEIEKETPDEEKILQYRMQKLYRGMELFNGQINNKYGYFPY